MFVFIGPAEKLLSQGISLKDYASFVASPAGETFYKDEVACVYMQADSWLYVPGGCLIHMVHDRAVPAKKKSPDSFGFVLAVALPFQKCRHALEATTRKALLAYNTAELNDKRTDL